MQRGQPIECMKKQQGKQRRFDVCSPGSFTLYSKDSRTKAKLLQALKIVDSNMPFASANGDAQRFKEMFPHSEIACKFDETTTSQVKKQYDGYVTYFSGVLQKVITEYVGSLFVGHYKDVDLLDQFADEHLRRNLITNWKQKMVTVSCLLGHVFYTLSSTVLVKE